MRLSLRLRFILVISGILLVIFLLIAFFLARNVRTSLNNNINQESKAFASLATKPIGDTFNLYKDSGSLRIQQEIEHFTDLDENISNVVIVDTSGKNQFSQRPQQTIKLSANEAGTFDTLYKTNDNGAIIQIIEPYFDDTGQHGYNMVYSISTAQVERTISRQELAILIFALLGLAFSALATYEFLNLFFLRPIQRVSELSGVIAAGYYSQQISLGRQDEIGDLAGSVNRMAQSLKANIEELQEVDKLKNEFIMITSHNLRTPLTIIEGNLSLMKDKALSPDIAKVTSVIEQSARRLNVFSEQMLTIANIEAGHKISTFEAITVADLLKPLIEEFAAIATDKKIVFNTSQTQNPAIIQASKRQLTGAVRNLLDNAFKFTPEGGNVQLIASNEGSKLHITITDSGIGIKASELPKLFTKFHRGTDTLEYNYEGTGIGLYVAKLIVEQHKGSITASSHEGRGSTFTIILPIAPKA